MEHTDETLAEMIYRYIFSDGHIEYSEHLGVERKKELEAIHGKLVVKNEV